MVGSLAIWLKIAKKNQVSSSEYGEQKLGRVCEGWCHQPYSYWIFMSITKVDKWWQDIDDC
jgi:hypothetical protein